MMFPAERRLLFESPGLRPFETPFVKRACPG